MSLAGRFFTTNATWESSLRVHCTSQILEALSNSHWFCYHQISSLEERRSPPILNACVNVWLYVCGVSWKLIYSISSFQINIYRSSQQSNSWLFKCTFDGKNILRWCSQFQVTPLESQYFMSCNLWLHYTFWNEMKWNIMKWILWNENRAYRK